ncbi:C4-type zinc ribbon domain-containing protein [Desulfovibrio sp. ZJ369]|uniref:zinc ribbon domain-containing protein n=1 Tax=Desulfovibrio sp. ZJ369 TaxID=2709793 RepID=UPI0013EE3BBA|nr:C4-type zinc ribbon domain-containing protein [Desulfovibrio sp. ZJ369]
MSSALYFDQIKQLVELQKVDDAIFAVRQELESAPRDLEELEQRFEAADAQRNRVLDKLAHLQEQQKRLSLEIDDDSARIKKSKNKLMQVGNTREYHAMMREMDSMEKVNRSREEEKMTLLEELQLQNDALAKIDRDYSALKAELEVKRDGLEEKLRKAKDNLEELNEKRSQVSKLIPQPVFMRYEFIRVRLEHPVIVAVKDGVCSGCNIAVPPQSFIELQRGQQILSCPNCQRLIFWCEHFSMPEEAPEVTAPVD